MSPIKRYVAEFMGTFWLVFGGCGSAVLAAVFTADAAKIAPNVVFPVGVGLVGVSMAFGLTVLTMAFAIGHISGCHLNPAVSFGLFFGKRFSGSELLPYIIAQVAGAILAGFILYLIASGKSGFEIGGFAANGYGENSPGKYGLVAAFLAEFVLTFMFLIIILGATDPRAPQGFAPVAIGLGLTLIHLIAIPVTNVSVNPARSTGPALILAVFGGQTWAIAQLWLFWLAPIAGAIAAGFFYSSFLAESTIES
ncbi:aquaporin Z [Kamptonema animale CS-326]|jgi:aquaporin Z|uniref:aquaporin Z n=1 Tax=Kamptonema animale TaxID=92934 RepID=UPI00232FB145|nr:aquaporin Z [Kamptonema animale]MDB9512034.1 aquaporin Z [Kamptonema animale CS-326]